MGFFSIFYWLKDHPNRSLKIITKFQFITKKYEYAIDIVTESGLITELKINLLYFKQIDDDQITGTKITLNCLEDPLNTYNVVKMFNQLLKLRYYKKGLLNLVCLS